MAVLFQIDRHRVDLWTIQMDGWICSQKFIIYNNYLISYLIVIAVLHMGLTML